MRLLNVQEQIESPEGTGGWRQSIAPAGAFVFEQHSAPLWATTELAGERVGLAFDDTVIYQEFAAVFGATPSITIDELPTDIDVAVELLARTSVEGFGYLRVTRNGRPLPAFEYFIGLGRPGGSYRVLGEHSGWTAVGDEGAEATFLVSAEHCLFRLTRDWPILALSLVFRAAFGVREDAILFHAASMSIHGRGFIIAGPQFAGKSTTSLALAARGHQFLSDEIAWFEPSTRELIDFRRPVGVREGIRAAAIDAVMPSFASAAVDWHGSRRLSIESLIPQQPAVRSRLHAVVFLKPFEAKPRLIAVQPTREHLPLLQPLPMSMLNTSPARRIMQLIQILSSVRVYELYPGHPDETALILEEAALA